MALCYMNLFCPEHKSYSITGSNINKLFNPEQSVKVELDSSLTLTHFKSAVRHLCNLEKESPSHTTDSKREQRVQVVLFNLLLDLAQYHDGKCKGPNHHFTVSLEPLLQNDHEAHSDIAVVAVYDNSQHLILLSEVKLNLKETFESIWHALLRIEMPLANFCMPLYYQIGGKSTKRRKVLSYYWPVIKFTIALK